MTKYNDLIDAQVRLLQAHVSLVEEMQRTAKTNNRPARIFRCALEEPLELAGYANSPSIFSGRHVNAQVTKTAWNVAIVVWVRRPN